MHRQRLFFLLMSLAAAAATPALGQTTAPTVGPASAQGAAYIPDFSGRWSHPYWPGFEPPASGPGPVTNRLRLREGPQKGASNPNQLVGDYTNPILKPWAAEIVKQHGEAETVWALRPPSTSAGPKECASFFEILACRCSSSATESSSFMSSISSSATYA
jgi:hypothetical protein